MKNILAASALALVIAGLLAWKVSDVREERFQSQDRQLLALLAVSSERCERLATGLLLEGEHALEAGASVGSFVDLYRTGEDVQVGLAAEKAIQALSRPLLQARGDRRGSEALLTMATSQARLCDLVRTPGAHSLTTFREATASQIETYQTSATRASLELGVSQPFSLGLSGVPGWIAETGHFSAAMTSCANVPAAGSFT